MSHDPTVVRPSFVRSVGLFVFCLAGMAGGFILAFGMNPYALTGVGVVAALFFLLTLVSIARGRPRVEITDDGFTFQMAVGERAYRWADIDGDFATHSVGLMSLVVFRHSPAYKAANKPRRPPVPGYDDAIGGTFKLSMSELADLLNRRKKAAG